MYSITERYLNNSTSIRKKIIPYEDYLQIKDAYINLKEKNDKLKESKQKLESILNQYQIYISDYKTSNNTIKLLLKKFEKKYKELYAIKKKNNFDNISIAKINNLRIINVKKNNTSIKSKKNKNINININNEDNQNEEMISQKFINSKNDNDITREEYNKTINSYIEIINNLKNEIKIKEELYKQKYENKINGNKLIEKVNIIQKDKSFKNLLITNDLQIKLINNYNTKVKKISDNLNISSKICEFNIISKIANKAKISEINTKNLLIPSKCYECNLLAKEYKNKYEYKLIISSKICQFNFVKNNKSYIPKEKKENKIPLSISSNLCVYNIIKKNKPNQVYISSKASELFIIHKIKQMNNLIISSKTCEYNIYNDDKNKLLTIGNNREEKDNTNQDLYILSKENELTISKSTPKTKIFNKLEISSNISEYKIILPIKNIVPYISIKASELFIIKDKDEKIEKEKEIKENIISNESQINIPKTFRISFPVLNPCPKESEIFIPKISKKLIFKELNVLSLENKIYIKNTKIKKEFKDLKICTNIEEISIKMIKEELKISFKINEINIFPDEKIKKFLYIQKLSIISKVSDINIIKAPKKIILEIASNISEVKIPKNKIKKNFFEIEKKQLNFIYIKNKKKEKRTKGLETQKAIIDNYINSINIGFDNINKYEDYNKINKEKDDEDSDNENDKLECEPVPSFILCIQKKENL